MAEQDARAALDAAIDAIEGAYEYFLAYAAQGRRTDRDLSVDQGPRGRLGNMIESLAVLPELARASVNAAAPALVDEAAAFFAALDRDAEVSAAAARLVLAQSDVSSQLIDNLNASIHLRAVLTDIFLLDEIARPRS